MALVALLSTISLNTLYLTYSKAAKKGLAKFNFANPLCVRRTFKILRFSYKSQGLREKP